jgi:hypothetical protein
MVGPHTLVVADSTRWFRCYDVRKAGSSAPGDKDTALVSSPYDIDIQLLYAVTFTLFL